MSSHIVNPPNIRNIVHRIGITLLILVPIVYGGLRSYPLLAGPHVRIDTPYDGQSISTPTFTVSGYATRANLLILQGKAITIDESGHFSETLIAHSPYTILEIVATDKYGATEKKHLRVLHTEGTGTPITP